MSLMKHFFSKQFLLFLIVGCFNTFNGVIFSALFNLFFSATTAFILGYICSLFVSYAINSKIVFKSKLSLQRLLKFVISYIPNFLIQYICVLTLINWLNIMPIITYTVAAIIGVPVTFLLMKLFAFRKAN